MSVSKALPSYNTRTSHHTHRSQGRGVRCKKSSMIMTLLSLVTGNVATHQRHHCKISEELDKFAICKPPATYNIKDHII